MTQNEKLAELSAAGVSVWLDDLSRDLISSGDLAALIDTKSVTGVTTNPSIFQAALTSGTAYDAQVGELAAAGANIIIYANHMLRSAYPAMVRCAETILKDGCSKGVEKDLMPASDLIKLFPSG